MVRCPTINRARWLSTIVVVVALVACKRGNKATYVGQATLEVQKDGKTTKHVTEKLKAEVSGDLEKDTMLTVTIDDGPLSNCLFKAEHAPGKKVARSSLTAKPNHDLNCHIQHEGKRIKPDLRTGYVSITDTGYVNVSFDTKGVEYSFEYRGEAPD